MGTCTPRKRFRCWRGETKDKGFSGKPTPTWAAAGAGNPGPVGVAWRKTKAFRGGRRQHGQPPARKIRALLAWRDEGQRLCREADANMDDRRRGKSGPCWRGVAKDKGFAGRPTPTWASARRGKRTGVGVTRRRTKAFRGGQRQYGLPRAEEKAPVLALRGEGQRLCREANANMDARRRGKSELCWRGETKDKGFAGRPRQHGPPTARKVRALLACPEKWIIYFL